MSLTEEQTEEEVEDANRMQALMVKLVQLEVDMDVDSRPAGYRV